MPTLKPGSTQDRTNHLLCEESQSYYEELMTKYNKMLANDVCYTSLIRAITASATACLVESSYSAIRAVAFSLLPLRFSRTSVLGAAKNALPMSLSPGSLFVLVVLAVTMCLLDIWGMFWQLLRIILYVIRPNRSIKDSHFYRPLAVLPTKDRWAALCRNLALEMLLQVLRGGKIALLCLLLPGVYFYSQMRFQNVSMNMKTL